MSQPIQLSALIFLIGLGSTHLNAASGQDETGKVDSTRTTIAVRSSASSTISENSDLTRRRAQNATDIKTQEHKLADMDVMIEDLVAENRRLCKALASCAGSAVLYSIMPLSQEADSESGDEEY